MVFNRLLVDPDKGLLEDILTQIGRENGVDEFIRNIQFKEANKILMHGNSQFSGLSASTKETHQVTSFSAVKHPV